MKKLTLLLIFIPLVFSCSGDDDGPTYYLELNSTQNRVEFNQITLPGYVLNPTSQQQTFTLDKGMSAGVNDVRVNLSGICSVGGRAVSYDVFVNFNDEQPTVVLSCSRVVTCTPNIVISYK
tara:strand:+ start:3150 stop:3512 length:363 start_codon:yes stop_codon:yes gene_type:complete